MARTPDRRPGPTEEEEEIRFYANATPPTTSGSFNYDGNDFIFYDSRGYLTLRGAGVFTVSGGFANTEYTASFGSGSSAAAVGSDVFFYVSGSPGSTGTSNRGVAAFGGDLVVTGSSRLQGGISGSLTKLTDGTSYLIASGGATITSNSNGSVSIYAPPAVTPGGADGEVQFNSLGTFAGSSLFTFDPVVGAVTASYFVGNGGGLTELTASQVYISGAARIDGYLQLEPVGNVVIPADKTAGYMYVSGSTNDIYFTQYKPNSDFNNTTRLRWLEGMLTTGLLHGGVLSTQNGTTTFSLTSGSGLIIDYNASTTTDPYPTVNFVSWPAYLSQSLSYVTSSIISYIGINPSGGIIQQTTPFSSLATSQYITIGRILHQNLTVTNGAVTEPNVSYGVNKWQDDFTRAFGPLKVSGHILAGSSSSGIGTLGLTKTAGDSYAIGRNYTTDPNSPNGVTSVTDIAATTSKIYRTYVSGSTVILDTGIANAGYTSIDPGSWNDNGTLNTVAAGQYSIQRVYWFPNSVNKALYVYYGQATYNSLDLAQQNIASEVFTEGENTANSAILVGYILVKGNATDLTNSSQARILQAGISRGAGAGGGGGVAVGSTTPGGIDTYVQFNDGGSTFGGDAGLTYNKTTDVLTIGNISIGDTGIVSTTGTTISLFDTTATTVNFAGGASSALLIGNSSGINTISGSTTFPQGISGSITRLPDGSSYLIAGTNVIISSASNGAVTIDAPNTGPAGGALTGSYPNPGLANRPVLVFQPGSPSTSDNVFTTWSSLMSAFSGSTGQVVIEIDTTYGAASVDVGVHDLEERAILQGLRTDYAAPPVLSLPDGAVLKDPRIVQQLEIVAFGTSTPNFEITSRGIVTFRLGYITTSGNQPLIRLSGTDDMILQMDELQIVNNTPSSAIIDVSSATASATLVAYRGVAFGDDNVISGVGSSYLGMLFDSSVTVGFVPRFPTNPNFLGSSNSTLLDNSALVAYDDSLVAGAYGSGNVQGALDAIKKLQYFISTTPNAIYTTSSVAIRGLESSVDAASDKGTDVFFYVSGSRGSNRSLFGGDVVASGSIVSLAGFSGSLTRLSDGSSFIVAGDNVIVTSSSIGQITVSSILPAAYWQSVTSGLIYTTGSAEITGSLSVYGNTFLYGTVTHGTSSATGINAHAQGLYTTGSGNYSHAEGNSTVALGEASHSEGFYATANGSYSHAEGIFTLALGEGSHAEGYLTTASVGYSHAEGYLTIASGTYSRAAGIGTIASGSGQAVFGSYNTQGNTTSLFVVGDGSNNTNRRDVLRVNQQSVEVTGSIRSTLGLSGSLTQLADGTSYIRQGVGLIVASSSNGPITLSINDSVVATISGSTFTGAVKFNGGLSGSLTNLTDGSRYIVAGPNITIATSSIGQISISASLSGDGSNGNLLTANGTGGINAQPNLNFDGSTFQINGSQTIVNDLTVNGSMVSINSTNLDIKDPVIGIGFASGSVKQTAGDRGWIGGLASLDNVLFKWDNAVAEFVLARTTASSTASLPIPISSYANLHTNNIQANIITASLGFSGSLTRLADGTAYILGGTNVSVVSSSNGGITISAPNLALASSPYVTIGNDANLTSERALTAGTGLTLSDAGANSTVTLAINDSVVATVSGTTFSGAVKFNAGLSGSLTHLVDGTSYLRSGDYISITSASNGAVTVSGTGIAPVGSSYVTIGNDSTLTNERSLTAGTGLTLTDGGANSTVTLSINDSIVATVSGTTFTGATKHNAGLSGSLTHLVDGTSYLIAGTGISITSQSNGAVTVTSTAVTSPAGSDAQLQFNDGGSFGASSLLTFNKTTGALTASVFTAPIMSASSVMSASKTYSLVSEVDGYLKINPYESSLISVGTTDSTYIFSSQSTGKLYFSSYHDEDNSTQTTSLDWLKGGALRTGLLFGGKLTTAVGSTTFSITSGSGLIVDFNTSDVKDPYPIINQIRWSNFVSQSLTFVTSSQLSYIGIDKNANIVQQTSPFTPADRANVLVLGRISHPTLTTAQLANMFPDTAYGTVEWHEDFTRAFGPLKISGHKLTASGSSLRVNKGAGSSYIAGGNYFYNTERPNYILDTEDTEKTNIVYTRLWVSGSDLKIEANPPTGFSALDPDNYNLDGTKTAVPSGSFSVLRLYWIPRNSRDVINSYYGSEVYDTLGEAVAGITTENFVESDNTKTSNIFLGYVAVQSGSTDLSDPLKAKIIQGGLSRNVAGGGGGAAGTGAGSLPGGIAGYVQYNLDGTNFGGDAEFTYNATTNVLTVGNAMIGGTGELMGSSTTFDLLDTTVQTINFGGAATTIDVGSTGGTTNLFGVIKAPQGLSGSLTQLTDGSSYLISSGNISITSASNGAVTIGTTAIGPTEHRTVRQLVHLAEEGGPFEGFTLGSYMETLPAGSAFPTSIIWWEDSSKVKKIVEETITYNSQKLVTTDQWKVYDTDGTTVLTTATDTINYSGVFEINRTRTIT